MALARNQITLIDVNDGYVGGDGKSYVLNILGGQRSIIYDQDGTGYSPAPTSFTAELIVDGVVTPPTNYAWSAQGHLSGTGNGASFTPSYAASFNNSLSVGDAIFLTVTYNGMTIRNVAPIAVSKVGTNGIPTYTWVRYADDISGNGISDLPAGKPYIGFAHNKLTPTESDLPGDYTWSLIKGEVGPQGPQGAKGDTGATGPGGAPAKLVKINASATIFKSGDGGATFNPATIVLTPTLQGGVTYSNWQYSTNGGSTWTAVTSGQNDLTISSGVLTIAKTSALFTILITSVVFKVNTNDATVSDTITISKLYDVVDLGQQAIFDRLTGGGANEGLFLSDGKVYINGTYIRTGNLVAGNAMIQNGYLNTAVIQDGTIVTAKIGDAQITNAKIANLAVDSAKIADAAITTAKIGDAQITNALIANATIEAAKIKSINASTITTGTLSADRIQGGTLTMGGASNGNGLVLIKDLLNREVMKLDKDGLIIDMFYNAQGEPTNQFLIRDGVSKAELLKIGASGELYYSGVATFNELFLDSTLHLWADLNAWGNTIVNGSGNLGIQDSRASNMPTNLGEKGVRFDFKSNAAQSLNDGGTYHSTMTIQPWSDSSGGNIAQLAFTSNGNMWLRSTPIGGTWPDWKRVALSDDSIVASGSNANGRYLRFGDGTLICWEERTFSTTVTLGWGSLFYHAVQSWSFPYAFVGAKPVCSANYIDSGAELIGMVPNSTLTNITFYGLRPTSVAASTSSTVRLMAIGRWK